MVLHFLTYLIIKYCTLIHHENRHMPYMYVNYVVYFPCYIVYVILHMLGYILNFSLNLLFWMQDSPKTCTCTHKNEQLWNFISNIIYFQLRIERCNIPIDIDDISCNLVWWTLFNLSFPAHISVDTVETLSLAVCFSLKKIMELATSLLVGMTLSAKCSALK